MATRNDPARKDKWHLTIERMPWWRVLVGDLFHRFDMAIDKPLHKVVGIFSHDAANEICMRLDFKCWELNSGEFLGRIEVDRELAAKISPDFVKWGTREG